MSKKIEFYRDSKHLTASASEITAVRLASAFQVEVDSLYLKEDFGDLALWPTDGGRFNFTQVNDGTSFEVMGDAQSIGDSLGSSLSYTPSPTVATSTANFPKRPFTKKSVSTSTFACKIIMADMKKNGKAASFTEQGQTYINLNEDTANVKYITEQVKEKTGKKLILVSGNGLPITDEQGTRGAKFWKCPSRRVYATPDNTKRGKKHSAVESVSSDSDSESMFTKKKRISKIDNIKNELSSIQQEVSNLTTSLDEVNRNIRELTDVSNSMALPLSVAKLIGDAFKCKVCLKKPMNPPIIATKCCNSLLGCAPCINHWYSGDDGLDKACPHCREPRGYANTCQFKGLDDFLEGMKKNFHSNPNIE